MHEFDESPAFTIPTSILNELRYVRRLGRALTNPTGPEALSFLRHEYEARLSTLRSRLETIVPRKIRLPQEQLELLQSILREVIALSTLWQDIAVQRGELARPVRRGKPNERSENPRFGILLNQDPLTLAGVEWMLSTLTILHTQCSLIASGRFGDFALYNQNRSRSLETTSSLVIEFVNFHSPLEFGFNLDLSPKGIAEALQIGIDAAVQARQRRLALELANAELESKIQAQELQINSVLQTEELERDLAAQRAQNERERLTLDLERERFALARERIEFQMKAIDWALETANDMVQYLSPDIDEPGRLMLIQGLVPQLLQLANIDGLQLALPAQKSSSNEVTNRGILSRPPKKGRRPSRKRSSHRK